MFNNLKRKYGIPQVSNLNSDETSFLLAIYIFLADLTRSVYFHLLFHCHYFPYLVLPFVFKFNCRFGNRYF